MKKCNWQKLESCPVSNCDLTVTLCKMVRTKKTLIIQLVISPSIACHLLQEKTERIKLL